MTSKKQVSTKSTQCDTLQPTIIPREQHTISRKKLDREALKVMHRLRDAGFKAFLVGGGVRDILLGKAPKDFDISTDARPAQIRKIFRNSRIIGRRFRLVQVFFTGNKIVEVATFRRSSEFDCDKEDTVLPANNTFGTPCEDAFRRDLTINAMFYEIENLSVLDYTGGMDDLKQGVVRLVGDADRRVTRDPVRIMRVIRHAARTHFTIAPDTWKAIGNHLDKLALCPTSRIRDELLKDLLGGTCQSWMQLAVESGLLAILLPVYAPLLSEEPDAVASLRDELCALCGVVDRIVGEGHLVPDHVLFALLLLPWGGRCMNFDRVETLKDSSELVKETRHTLSEIFARLNVKKGVQDSIARCFATFPLLCKHDRKGPGKGWPKWLRRKSYFADGSLLYGLVEESKGNGVTGDMSGLVPVEKQRQPPQRKAVVSNSHGPAFAKNVSGGVFGFRRW